jgi:hypothetical protein
MLHLVEVGLSKASVGPREYYDSRHKGACSVKRMGKGVPLKKKCFRCSRLGYLEHYFSVCSRLAGYLNITSLQCLLPSSLLFLHY